VLKLERTIKDEITDSGFASVDREIRLCSFSLTSANVYDAQALPWLHTSDVQSAVVNSLYGARMMRDFIWETYGAIIVAPPRPMAIQLACSEAVIKSLVDCLKKHL
jgi:transposase